MRTPRRGCIYRLKSDRVGKTRPVLIVSPTAHNKGAWCLAAPFYSEQIETRRKFPFCVVFAEGEFGLEKECALKLDEVSLFKQSELRLADGMVGEVSDERMQDVDRALLSALGIDATLNRGPSSPSP
jgi:mRNA-degrading endonuclease toxin of MazEF toxin-antitoxin module